MRVSIKKLFQATALSVAIGTTSWAQAAWPSDAAINVTVGFAPGGSTDVMVRVLAPYIAKQLGDNATIVVQNRPGASGELAINNVMRARPDGYSFVIVNMPGYFFVPMARKSSYTTKDLTLVARVMADPTIMVTRKDGKLSDLKQAIAALKASPSAITAGHNGLGTNGHLAMAQLESVAKVKFNAIPYNGTAQQKLALASNTLDIAFLAASEVPNAETEATPVRVLAQFTKDKVQRLVDVPTTHELGLAVDMTAERGFAAPNGVPAPILDRFAKAVEAAMKDPEYIKAARNDAPFLAFLGGAQWSSKIEEEARSYQSIASSLPKD